MEIYNLKDFVKENEKKFEVTNLKQGLKNPNRVNVFINNEYSFSLGIAQVVDYKIKVGRKITEEELLELKKASEFGKIYQRTLEWVLVRPRSERETRDYLRKKLCDNPEEIISRLHLHRYLDDKKFAKWWVENRFTKKGVSEKRLRVELMKKGVAKEIVDEVFSESGRNDEEEIRKIIAKKRMKYDDEKLMAYLARQGFSYDLIKDVLDEMKEN